MPARSQSTLSRRSLLQRATLLGAAAAGFPTVVPSSVIGADAPSNHTTVGCIGVGGRGSALMNEAGGNASVRVVGIADCFTSRREGHTAKWNQKYGPNVCTAHRDFRELLARGDIDCVTIGTPDHWHVPAALLALRAGKDVYVEKPLGISMEELFTIRGEVNRLGRIFQYGTQQRSIAHVRHGCELIRNGRLGKLKHVEVTAPSYGFDNGNGGSLVPAPVPPELDYEMWLGPAPWRPYTKDRCTSWGTYWCSDNAHGFIGGWGAHPLTDMVWALGDKSDSIPVEYQGTGKCGTGLFDAPYDWDISGVFASGVTFHFTPGPDCVTFTGEKGRIAISRGRLVTEPESLKFERFGPDEVHLYQSRSHMGNYIDCVRTRRPTIAPVEVAFLSDAVTQLSMLAIWTGRKIRWDHVKETVIDDPGALQLFTRAMRRPWHL